MGTTINSSASKANSVEVFRCPDGDVLLSLRHSHAIYVRETELLDALGAKSQERWDEAHRSAKAERDEWKARAEKAEAAIQRAREAADEAGGWLAPGLIEKALSDKPAFTLPTEAGARFEARMKQDPEQTRTFTTFVGSPGEVVYAYFTGQYGWYTYDANDVFEDFTDHRLIGAQL